MFTWFRRRPALAQSPAQPLAPGEEAVAAAALKSICRSVILLTQMHEHVPLAPDEIPPYLRMLAYRLQRLVDSTMTELKALHKPTHGAYPFDDELVRLLSRELAMSVCESLQFGREDTRSMHVGSHLLDLPPEA